MKKMLVEKMPTKKHKFKGHFSNSAGRKTVRVKYTLPPLSTEFYVFNEKKLSKKTKQVQATLQQAESLLLNELGQNPTLPKKKKSSLFSKMKKF